MAQYLEVGERRKFSFDSRQYEIREILELPDISMAWTYDTGVCPHCKHRLVKEVEHSFIRIEILGAVGKEDKDLTIDDIQLHGFTLDNRNMILTIDKYNEVFEKSEKFKGLKRV